MRAHAQIAQVEDMVRHLRGNAALAEIGGRLFVSRYTVKTHCASIYRKLNATSRSEAVEAARRVGLLEAASVGETT
jgi:LuxR family maltose regulon positive regulatory protein